MTDKLIQAADTFIVAWDSLTTVDLALAEPFVEALRQALAEPEIKRSQEREWVGLTDEEILAITFDAKITEPNDEPIKFGAPSRKCIKDLVSGIEAKLREKNCG